MPNSTGGREKTGGGPINQDSKVYRGDAAHDPVDSEKRDTNLNEDKPDICPVNTVKSLCEVQLEDKSTGILDFNRVKHFLNNTNRLNDLTVLKKPELFMRYAYIKEGFQSSSNNFSNEFVKEVTKGDRPKISKAARIVLLGDKCNKGGIQGGRDVPRK